MDFKIGQVASWLAVAGVISGAALTIYRYEERLNAIEQKIDILTVTPFSGASPTVGQVSDNPMVRACAEIALKAAKSIESGYGISEGGQFQKLFDDIGCI